MISLEAQIRIDSIQSSKYEFVFTKANKQKRILIKFKTSQTTDLINKFSILSSNSSIWDYILPFSYDKNFIDQLNWQFSMATYDQIEMRTLRDEIQNKISMKEKFSMEEIFEIHDKVQKSLNFLYGIQIYPSFLTIDNICYDPTKPSKNWVLNIQNFFNYTAPDNFDQQYFTYQFCEEYYETLQKKTKLIKFPSFALQKENLMNLGVCLLQACLLQPNNNDFTYLYNNNNLQIRTLNYSNLFTNILKIIAIQYNGRTANLLKYLIFTPQKCIKSQGESFSDYFLLIEQIGNIQDIINNKQPELALQKIDQVLKREGKIEQSEILKLKIFKSQCFSQQKKYKEVWTLNNEVLSELKATFFQQKIIDQEQLVLYLKQFSKQFMLAKELNDSSRLEKVLNQILNEIQQLQKLAMKQAKQKKAFCIKNLQALLQFLNQLFPQLSCSSVNIEHSVEYFAQFIQISSNICLTLFSLMKKTQQYENYMRKQFYCLKEIQSDLVFIAQLNYNRLDDLMINNDSKKMEINEKRKSTNQKNASKKKNKQFNFVQQQQFLNHKSPESIRKQIC